MGQGGGWADGAGGLRARRGRAGQPQGTLALCEDTQGHPKSPAALEMQRWSPLSHIIAPLLPTSFHKTSST